MIKQSYTFEELLPYLKPTEKYQFNLWDLEESDFYYHLKSDSSNIDHSKFGELIGNRIQEYPILQSYCTDTVVGEHVYVMDGVVAWSTYQSGRKCDINFEIHSNEKYLELLALARSCFFDSDEERDYIIDKYLKIDIARMAYIFHKNRIDTIQYVLSNPNDAIKEVEHANAKEIRLQINR